MTMKSKTYKILGIIVAIIIIAMVSFRVMVKIHPPEISDMSALDRQRKVDDDGAYHVGNSWLKQNNYGLWELYVEGDAFELGAINGKLTQELILYQEEAFVDQIREMVPSEGYLRFLKYFIAWFNRDLDDHIPLEYQKEIYGISLHASSKFDFIAPNYYRILNYHAAHDIGHTLQNMNLVACTAFGVRNGLSEDSSLVVGRNMDFYMGDKFAENKIVAFYRPDSGYNFAFITWGGMIGVLSGMNDQGLTVSINAAKSSIPAKAKTPVSILARTILQYASTIEDAHELASRHETFVAESFLISSAKDNSFAVIEKSPDSMGIYYPKGDNIILTNHFQGQKMSESSLNKESIEESETLYRRKRTAELLHQKQRHDEISIATILRDQKGLDDKNIGIGNEMAINQLICHHSIIFKPGELMFWVSTAPYQLGTYLAYDLKEMFDGSSDSNETIFLENKNIPSDTFIYSKQFKHYKQFKKSLARIEQAMDNDNMNELDSGFIDKFVGLNPQHYLTYSTLGDYYWERGNKGKATEYYSMALTKAIPRKSIIKKMENRIDEWQH